MTRGHAVAEAARLGYHADDRRRRPPWRSSWVAEEKGYFATEGLDYEFREAIGTKDAERADRLRAVHA
jgi:hypothetical protein